MTRSARPTSASTETVRSTAAACGRLPGAARSDTIRAMKSFVVLVALIAACGSKSPSGPTTPTTTAAAGSAASKAPPPPLPDLPFDKLDHAQKIQFMTEKVVPAMEPLFKAHDAKDFADFGCKTCHDPKAIAKDEFKMPNPELPKLDFGN